MARERNLIEIIRLGEKVHYHLKVRSDVLFNEISSKFGGKEEIIVKIEPRDLYEVPSKGFLGFLIWIFTGRGRHYIMVINSDGSPIEEKKPEISGKVLKVARDWKGLGKAIRDSFGSNFEMPRIALVGAIALGIIILVFLVWKGWIPLPRSWSI